jgi:hypothetical protein
MGTFTWNTPAPGDFRKFLLSPVGFKLTIFLPQPSEWWGYRHVALVLLFILILSVYMSPWSTCIHFALKLHSIYKFEVYRHLYNVFLMLGTLPPPFFFFFFWWGWSLNSGLCACKTGTLLLEAHLQPFYSGYFGDGVLRTICWSWPGTLILQISAFQLARIIGVSCQRPVCFVF